jgi:RNase P protein component
MPRLEKVEQDDVVIVARRNLESPFEHPQPKTKAQRTEQHLRSKLQRHGRHSGLSQSLWLQ